MGRWDLSYSCHSQWFMELTLKDAFCVSLWFWQLLPSIAFDTSGVRTGSEKAKHTESPSVTANSFLAAPREKVTTDRLNRVGRIEWLLGSVWVTLSTGGENKFLGLNVSEDLSWSQKQWDNNSSFCSCWGGLRRFYQRDFKSILSGCIVILHWMVRSSQCITKKKKKAKKNRWILYARVKLS